MRTQPTPLPNVYPMPFSVEKMVEKRLMANLRRYARFEVDVDNWYRYGDGRSVADGGRGHRYPYACVHGADAWVDYDNICGPCEGGYGSWNYAEQLADAYREARWAKQEVHRRVEAALPLLSEAWGQLSRQTRDEINAWVKKPITEF